MKWMRVLSMTLAVLGATMADAGRAAGPSYGRIASASRRMMAMQNRGMANRTRNAGNGRQAQHQIAQELRTTRALLARADHDYNGQRSRAVHEINVALNALGQGGRGSMNGNGHMNGGNARLNNTGTNRQGNREPQSVSDAQLRQAVQNLSTIQGQLASHSGPPNARAAVQRAIAHLNMALRIR